jgi:hypothetical protein
MTVYDTCSAQFGGDSTQIIQCVADWVEAVTSELSNATALAVANANAAADASNTAIDTSRYVDAAELNSWLLVLAGSMVFFMQVRER